MMFIAQSTGGDHTNWMDRFDEAMRHARSDAIDMCHDCGIMGKVQERMLAISTLKWHLEVPDEKDKFQVKVKDGLTRLVKGISDLPRIIPWLAWSVWFGRYGVQAEWKKCEVRDDDPEPEDEEAAPEMPGAMPAVAGGMGAPPGGGAPASPFARSRLTFHPAAERHDHVLRYLRGGHRANPDDQQAKQAYSDRLGQIGAPHGQPGKLKGKPGDEHKMRRAITISQAFPVHGDSIGHQQDGTPFILVNGSMESDLRKLDHNVSIVNTTIGRALSLRGTWRSRFIIHKQFMETRDYYTTEQQEAVWGVGIRSHLFWTNFLKLDFLGKISDFYARVGLGINLWKYTSGNPQAQAAVAQAAREQSDRVQSLYPGDPGRGEDQHVRAYRGAHGGL